MPAGPPVWAPAGCLTASMIVRGVIYSLLGLGLVLVGGFKVLKWLMSACIDVMFVEVVVTAVKIQPTWPAVGRGFVTPSIP
jgi:hypothetical protein